MVQLRSQPGAHCGGINSGGGVFWPFVQRAALRHFNVPVLMYCTHSPSRTAGWQHTLHHSGFHFTLTTSSPPNPQCDILLLRRQRLHVIRQTTSGSQTRSGVWVHRTAWQVALPGPEAAVPGLVHGVRLNGWAQSSGFSFHFPASRTVVCLRFISSTVLRNKFVFKHLHFLLLWLFFFFWIGGEIYLWRWEIHIYNQARKKKKAEVNA